MKTKYIHRCIALLAANFILTGICCSQNNSLVLNGAYIIFDGGTVANNIYMVVDQSSTSGIIRPGGGQISSEGQYNYLKWTAGTTMGVYVFPFGVGGNPANYIPFTFNKTSAGNSNISVSTWTTNPQNEPHPTLCNVGPVTFMTGVTDSIKNAIDRFWDILSPSPVKSDLTFSYRGSENTTLVPGDTMKAQHWNGVSWDTPVGPGNPGITAGIGSVGPIPGQSTFSPWVLIRTTNEPEICDVRSIFLPNAFSPNGDGQNDVLYLRGPSCITQMRLLIYDRWGELVFTTTNLTAGWNGMFRGKEMDTGVFFYYLTVDLPGEQSVTRKGNITLLR